MTYLRIFSVPIIAIFFSAAGLTQVPGVSWYKSYGGEYLDQGECLIPTADGGYLIAGFSYVSITGGTDIYLIKTDRWGIREWERVYGGASDDWASCVIQAEDGGYIVAGGTESYGAGGSDVLLMQIDYAGEMVWLETYGGADDEAANYICQAGDGGLVVSGWTNSFGAGADDIYLIKTDRSGGLLWTRTFGGQFYDKGYKVVETADGGYVLVGGINYFAFQPADACLIKTDTDGDTLWTSVIGGSFADACNALTPTADGGFVIAGWTMSFGAGQHDFYMVKVDSAGTQRWYKTYGGAGTDVARSVCALSDGGFIVAGYTDSFGHGEYDIYLVKTNYKGDSLWADIFGGALQDYGSEVVTTLDDGLAITGWTRSFSTGSKDVLLLKYDGVQTFMPASDARPLSFYLGQNYPNPFNQRTIIEFAVPQSGPVSLTVYDVLGREVAEILKGDIEISDNRIIFDASELASGIYVYRLQAGELTESKKMILAK